MKWLRSYRARLFWFCLLVFAVMLALQISWSSHYRTASGTPASFAPYGDELRRDDGSVDYRATLNHLLGEVPPPEENAVTVYIPLLCQRELADPEVRAPLLKAVGLSEAQFASGKEFFDDWTALTNSQQTWDALESPWPAAGDAAFPEVAAWLDRYRPQIDQIRSATHLKWHVPLVNQPEAGALLDEPLPHVITQIRVLMRILSANARREVARGNLDAAIADLAAINRLGLQVRGGFWVNSFVSNSLCSQARGLAVELLQTCELNDDQLVTLAASLQAAGLAASFGGISARAELYGVLDLLQELDRGTGSTIETQVSESTGALIAVLKICLGPFVDHGQVLQQVNQYPDIMQGMIQIEGLRGSTLETKLQRSDRQIEYLWLAQGSEWGMLLISPSVRGRILGRHVVSFFMPGNAISNLLVRTEQDSRLVQLSIAIERFQRRHGGYPQALKQLVPEFLTELPGDLFVDSGTFGYQRLTSGFRVYASPSRPPSLPLWSGLKFEILIQRPAAALPEDK